MKQFSILTVAMALLLAIASCAPPRHGPPRPPRPPKPPRPPHGVIQLDIPDSSFQRNSWAGRS